MTPSCVPLMLSLAASGLAAGCASDGGARQAKVAPVYLGAEFLALDKDLVNIVVQMGGQAEAAEVQAYAKCVAAQYTLQKGYGFARHLRTNLAKEGGVWRADAVYTISSALPRGVQTIDAEVIVDSCAAQGIPTV